jgi:hypothetical protein
MFNIDDPHGDLKKTFLRAVGARVRQYKSNYIARFITKTRAPKEGSATADLRPWEVYPGRFTEDEWKAFEEYVTTSEEFKVIFT